MEQRIPNQKSHEQDGLAIDFKTIWSILVLNWYWFILSAVIFVAGAALYLRYEKPVYSSALKILIKDDQGKGGRGGMNGSMELANLGVISNTNGFENELEILRSKKLATSAVKTLKLYVSYASQGRISSREIYKNSPILVDIEESRLDDLKFPISMEITPAGEGIRVKGRAATRYAAADEEGAEQFEELLTSLPATIATAQGKVIFQRNPGYTFDGGVFEVRITPPASVGRAYAASLSAGATDKNTTVANLVLVNTNVQRSFDYLVELVNAYNADANEDKNEVARKTEAFINERIAVLQKDLNNTEDDLEKYKKNNELINLKNDATAALASSSQYQEKQVELQTQLTLVKSLIDYCSKPENHYEVIPVNLGLNNNDLTAQISTYNEAVLRRKRLLKSSSESSPVVAEVTSVVESYGPAIRQSLQAVHQDLQMQKQAVDKQYALFMGKISNTPTQERVLNDIGRQQEIQAGLYLMLLQKREENSISLSSTAAKARLIDNPEFVAKVAPRTAQILLVALVLGLALPMGLLLLARFLRYKIEGREDVERLTSLSILADIPLAHKGGLDERAIVVRENSNDMMEEAFRGLRTNLRFIISGKEKVLLFTSVIPGEGKTFVASNLAMSLALMGKKVLIIGLDVRKPRLVRLFGMKKDSRGITTFLAGGEDKKELLTSQISHGVAHPNLDVLPAGMVPPNPAELITSPLLDRAIDYCRELYDYVILDTPPVGLVSDTLDMGRVADASFFICRADYSPKNNLDMVNAIADEAKLPKVNLVLNGVDLSKKKYGYYYGYGKYGKYGRYGRYGQYGHYGTYGNYGTSDSGVES